MNDTHENPVPVVLVRPSRASFAANVAGTFLTTWLLMLCLGGLHSSVAQMPPLGYWKTMLLILSYRFLTTRGSSLSSLWANPAKKES